MHFKTRMVAAAVFIGFAATPGLAQKPIDEIITKVNGDIILKSEYEAELKKLSQQLAQEGLQGAQLQQTLAEQSKHILRELIDTKLLVQVAREHGLNADLDVVRQLERVRIENNLDSMEALEAAMKAQGINVDEQKQSIRENILKQQVLQREVFYKVQITTEESRVYYEANKKDFDKPEGIRLSEIGIVTEKKTPAEVEAQKAKAEEAIAALKKGDDFAAVAKKYSELQTASQGGDLGFFQKGQLAEPLEQAAAKLEKGQFTEIITLPYGLVIVKITDKHAGGVLPFELAQDEIGDMLWRQRIQPKIREYLTKLRMDGFVKVNEGYVDTGAPPATASKPGKN